MEKSNQDHIDQLFKEQLEQHSATVVDSNVLWDQIQNKKDRRKSIFYLLGIGMLIILFSLSELKYNAHITEQFQVNSSSSSVTQSTSLLSISPNKTAHTSIASDQTPSEIETIEKNTKKTATLSIATSSESGPSNDATSAAGGGGIDKEKLLHQLVEIADKYNSETPVLEDEDQDFAKHDELTEELLDITSAKLTASLISLPKSITQLEVPDVQMPVQMPLLKRDRNPLNDCVIDGGSRLFFDVYTSGTYSLDQMSLSQGSDRSDYLALWDERYQTLPGINFGAQIGYKINNNAAIKGGIEYQTFQTQYTEVKTITERTTIIDPMAFFYYDANNEIVWVADTVLAISIYDQTNKFANTISQLNLPVSLEYKLVDRKPFSVTAEAGMNLNFRLNYKGVFLDNDGSLTDISNMNDTYLAPSLGIGVEGGLRFGYFLGDHWEAAITPSFSSNQSSYWRATRLINQSRNFVKLKGGVRYHF